MDLLRMQQHDIFERGFVRFGSFLKTFWTRLLGEILTILYYNCGYLKTISHYGFQDNQ